MLLLSARRVFTPSGCSPERCTRLLARHRDSMNRSHTKYRSPLKAGRSDHARLSQVTTEEVLTSVHLDTTATQTLLPDSTRVAGSFTDHHVPGGIP